ncbi:MAG: DUF4427 domain-containing protein [Leptothrix sp. (in: b-proteobacteria)]
MSGYALTFPKSAMHKLGASPVIYGLADRNMLIPSGAGGGPRSFLVETLSLQEQHRYVTYNPSGPYKVDWMHEREWRWPYQDSLECLGQEIEEFGMVSDAASIPGFDFSCPTLKGIGIIVKTQEDAKKIKYDVLALIDRKVVRRDHFDHILVREELPDTSCLISPKEVQNMIDASLLDFSGYFSISDVEVRRVVSDFSARVHHLEKTAPAIEEGEDGGCWLWFHDNSNPYVRALVQAGRISVNKEGRYVASLDELDDFRDLRQRERLAGDLAREIYREVGTSCSYFSVRGSTNPDGIPFYVGGFPEDDLYHNRG